MKFYTNPALRYFYRYACILVFVGLPLWMSSPACWHAVVEEDRMGYIILCWMIALCGAILIHVGMWEKFFAVLIVTEDEISWKCPLRKTKVIAVSKCVEIGAYIENANNGIPTEQIYFCDYADPQKNMGKNGVMKSSEHLIKFWYTYQLCEYLIKTLPEDKTSCLVAYKKQRKDY